MNSNSTVGKPLISIVVIFHNMKREAKRTLYSLTPSYQYDVDSSDYEVIAIDSGSSEPLEREYVESFGENFRYLRVNWEYPSPCRAMNIGVDEARGDIVVCLIDGARILSPGILSKTKAALDRFTNPFVYTLSMHIGPKVQNESVLTGYNQDVEDKLLDSIDWRQRGYQLFDVSSVALSSRKGFFSKLIESNCFAISKDSYKTLGGFDERFVSRGGGLVNLNFFNNAMQSNDITPVILMGEATFHQYHGGVATNVPMEEHPWAEFASEYKRIYNKEYHSIYRRPIYFGNTPPEAKRLVKGTVMSRFLNYFRR